MAKVAALFVVTLVFHLILADPTPTKENPWLHGIAKQMQEESVETSNAIQDAQILTKRNTRALESQINEWVIKVQGANYHLERAVQYYEGTVDLPNLDHIIGRINEISNSMKNALIGGHDQMKFKLRTHILDIAGEAQKLCNITEQHLLKEQKNQPHIAEELEEVLEELLDATRHLSIRKEIQDMDQPDIKNKIQNEIKELAEIVDDIGFYDELAARELAHQTQELSHEIGRLSRKLRRDARNRFEGERKNGLLQVVKELNKIRTTLDRTANAQERSSIQSWINELKNQLRNGINNIGTQLERLVQLLSNGERSNQDIHANILIRSVIADVLSEGQRLEWQLENIETQKH